MTLGDGEVFSYTRTPNASDRCGCLTSEMVMIPIPQREAIPDAGSLADSGAFLQLCRVRRARTVLVPTWSWQEIRYDGCLLYAGQALVHTIPYRAQLASAPPLQNSRRLEPGLPKSHGDTILAASPHSPPAPPLHH